MEGPHTPCQIDKRIDSLRRPQDATPPVLHTLQIKMGLGVGLDRRGRYVQSRDLFRRPQETRPNDARVWYSSALANGMTAGTRDGETKRLVEKGVELERAGDPSPAQINAGLAPVPGPSPRRGKDLTAPFPVAIYLPR